MQAWLTDINVMSVVYVIQFQQYLCVIQLL